VSGSLLAAYHRFGVFNPENGSCMFPRNVGVGLQPEDYTAQQAGGPPIYIQYGQGRIMGKYRQGVFILKPAHGLVFHDMYKIRSTCLTKHFYHAKSCLVQQIKIIDQELSLCIYFT
jgi:hypothetical protein